MLSFFFVVVVETTCYDLLQISIKVQLVTNITKKIEKKRNKKLN